ncbi:MAG TPA: alpha/beta hydrolase [Acidimicrobiia bacterium]
MRTLWTTLRLFIGVVAAILSVIGRRLTRGPLVPGWSWGLEVRREMLHALLATGTEIGHPERWADLRFEAPLPRSLRGLVTVQRDTVNGVAGEWLRLPVLPMPRPIILYIHGGGFVIGSPGMERPFIAHLAASARATAFSVSYRLAPRHRFPAALVDVTSAYLGLLELGIEPRAIVVAGDSAGGNLAAALLVRLRDEGLPLPGAAVLFSAWLDLAVTASTVESNAGTDYLPIVDHDLSSHYLGDIDPTSPWASPMYADLTGLPPLLIAAGGREIILEDSTRFADRARDAGVDVTLYIEEDMFHAWASVAPNHPVSKRTFLIVSDWIDAHRSWVG